ncbi:hypothetical protein VMCG_05359 [Cytospora schulzeri]|uniref:Uncharacterized protein n=1 Tax=Cytospora schulzeri TaxID=448051 RepID=A0A423WJX5_9PEZI|nr:hypothetical protein VMCG_05359 [Valsa malicola]
MRASSALVILTGLAVSAYAASADEYTTEDCSGDASYPHSPSWMFGDDQITIDDTTKAVKTDATLDVWGAYSEKTDDGDCSGDYLGDLDDGCHNVDTFISGKRIECVALNVNGMGKN